MHPKINIIRELIEVIKESDTYDTHEDHCAACNYGYSSFGATTSFTSLAQCNCLRAKMHEVVEKAEKLLSK